MRLIFKSFIFIGLAFWFLPKDEAKEGFLSQSGIALSSFILSFKSDGLIPKSRAKSADTLTPQDLSPRWSGPITQIAKRG